MRVMMRARAVLVAILMLVAPVVTGGAHALETDGQDASGSADCADGQIPCGYISPVLIIELDEPRSKTLGLEKGSGPIETCGTVTFRFDIVQEGFGVHEPTKPIEVTLSITRKPQWIDDTIEPRTFEVPISPQYIQTDTSDPTQPGAHYVYTKDICLTLEKNDLPIVIEDPNYDFTRMGLYARSTESGLYKPAYGYREVRMAPQGYDIVRDASKVTGVFAEVPRTSVPFHNVEIEMNQLTEVSLWQPAEMVFQVVDEASGQAVRHPDMWATVVDEEGEILYQTGFRHPHNGRFQLTYTFPDVGHYHVLVGARPTPQLSRTFWQPVVASFPVTLEKFGQPSYPATYNATFYESLQAFAGDPAGESQFHKTIPFPVKEGASQATLTAEMKGRAYVSPQQPPTFPSQVQVRVLDPDGGEVRSAMLTPDARSAELSFEPSATGPYEIAISGTGIHPLDYGVGAVLDLDLQVPYDDRSKITKANVDGFETTRTEVGNDGVTFAFDRPESLDPWASSTLTASVDAAGSIRDLIVTVLGSDGDVLYTQDTVESSKSLEMDYVFPRPGHYVVVVSAEPAPGTGASWQTQSAAFPVTVGDPDKRQVEYPGVYEASYTQTVAQVQGDTNTATSQYDRFLPFPVFRGADSVAAEVSLDTTSPGVLDVELLDGNGTQVDAGQVTPASPSVSLSPNPIRPDDYVVHVSGPSPVGTTYNVGIQVDYGDSFLHRNPLFERVEETADSAGAGELLPGFGVGAAGAAVAAALFLLGRDP